MTLAYEGDKVYFVDCLNNPGSEIFYAPTLGILMSVQKELSKKMKGHLSGEAVFEEFESLLDTTYDNRLPMTFEFDSMKSNYFHLALGITQNCTLDCVYCHASAGIDETMPEQLIMDAIDYSISNIKEQKLKGLNVSFAVGGEPTYNFELFELTIRKIRDECKKNEIPCNISITTNGFYPDSVATFVAENIDSVLLSLDGLEDVQNAHRPARNGGKTFGQIIRSLDIFYKVKGEVAVRSTVSNHSVTKLKPFADFLYGRYGSNVTLVLEPLIPIGKGENLKRDSGLEAEPIEPSVEKFGSEFWELYCENENRKMKIDTSALKSERITSGFCGAMYIPSFTVTTKGLITTCERDSSGANYSYGKYDADSRTFVLDQDAIERNRNNLKLPSKCEQCICLYHCAGDCPDVRAIGYDRCTLVRDLLIKKLSRELDERRT